MTNPIYNAKNPDSPRVDQYILNSNGSVILKTLAEDGNDKQQHEDNVLDLFMRHYLFSKHGISEAKYTIIGRDGTDGQRHDFTVNISEETDNLKIEITKLTDSGEVHKSHTLRGTAEKLAHESRHNYFAYLPQVTKVSEIPTLFAQADSRPAIKHPDPNDDFDGLKTFVNNLKTKGLPYVRRTKGVNQTHTASDKSQSLRAAVQEAVKKKEGKNYSPLKQNDMILVIDDKSLRFNREYIDMCAPLLEYYFMGSTFCEIHIISRKTSKSDTPDGQQEYMVTPIKAPWNKKVTENIIFVANQFKNGKHLNRDF